ncbi:MAG: ribonuclease P protein component [Methyloligellaceae bacterium]
MKIPTLKSRAQFLHMRKGIRWSTPSLILQINYPYEKFDGKLNGERCARFGFTVTKKLGTAVVRNRVKRRLKEAVAKKGMELSRPAYDYVVIGKEGAIGSRFSEIVEDLAEAIVESHKRLERRLKKQRLKKI